MRTLVVNFDSLSEERFNKEQFRVKGFTVKKFQSVKIRPGFGFLWEFLLNKPPSETKLWMDFVISDNSPYAWMKNLPFTGIPNRGRISKKIISMLGGKLKYSPECIPLKLLGYFNRHQKMRDIEKRRQELFNSKYGVAVDFFSGNIETIEPRVLKSTRSVVFANYYFLDRIGHVYGPNSEGYLRSIEKIYSSIRKLANSHKFDRIEVTSDHGMYEVNNLIKYLHLFEDLKVGKDFLFFANSPLLRLWDLGAGKNRLKNLVKSLENEGVGKILDATDYRKFKIPTDRAFGDVVFWLNRGHHLVPDFFWGNKTVKGMHGYYGWDKSKYVVLERNKRC